ncbi:MAG: aldo/keto reductase [Sphingomicrobium sp.]|nr:aldo/keto reductase [Sphingomonadales bacterium]
MQKRLIGMSGLEVAPLALGGNVFGWTADEATSFRILDTFVDAGGTMIDTADVYSAWAPGHQGGESETVIGKWLKRSGKRDKVVIATKVGFLDGKLADVVDGEYVASLDPHVIARACDASLQRLGVDVIDLYYQHRDNPKVPLADSLGAFDVLLKSGKIRAIGLSNFEPPRIEEALRVAHRGGLTIPSAYQGWYNMVERDKYEGPIEDVVTGQGLAMFPFYSLANGFLAGKYRSEADLSKSVRGGRNREYLEGKGPRVLAALDAVAAETGAPLAAVALAWTRDRAGITAPIASATSVEQLAEQLPALTLELTPAETQLLEEASG